jgi:tetratricopeptide (TPR) repeat protein
MKRTLRLKTTGNYVEEWFLDADRAFEEGNLAEGKRMLEDILREEPSFGKAHNHLGWLYKTKYMDFRQAEKHFKLALKFEPEYPATYLNYAYLLRDLGRLNDLEELLSRALKMESTIKFKVYDEYGSLHELRGNYTKAIHYYKLAISLCLNDSAIAELRNHIKRCRKKRGFPARLLNIFKR